jgi:hypothetical protein
MKNKLLLFAALAFGLCCAGTSIAATSTASQVEQAAVAQVASPLPMAYTTADLTFATSLPTSTAAAEPGARTCASTGSAYLTSTTASTGGTNAEGLGRACHVVGHTSRETRMDANT